jgi:hypothetical protein
VIGVSGGGNTAAAYHSVRWHSSCSDEDPEAEWGVLDPPAYAPETPEVQRLRRNSRYLLDSGNSALLGLMSLLFGITVNLVLLTAVLGATPWLLGWYLVASGGRADWGEVTSTSLDFTREPWDVVLWVWLIPAAGVLLFAIEKVAEKFTTISFGVRMWLRRISGHLITHGTVLTALLLGVPALLEWMHNFAATSGSTMANLLHTLGFVPSEVCIEQLTEGTAACEVMPPDDSVTTATATDMAGGSASVPGLSAGGAAAIIAAVLAVVRNAKGAIGGDDATDTEKRSGLGGLLPKVWIKVKNVLLPWAAALLVVAVLLVLLLRWTAGLVAVPAQLASWNLALGFLAAVPGIRLLTDANMTSLHHF